MVDTTPRIVRFKPIIKNLEEPLKFEWHFGDGTGSMQRIPGDHAFQPGKYSVTLKVIDNTAKQLTAGMMITVDYPCG